MKKGIHPKYYEDAKIVCYCGAELETGSTQKEMHVEICSQCHPFYTGKRKLIDSTGRVDRFKKINERVNAKKAEIKAKITDKKEEEKSAEAKKLKAKSKEKVKKAKKKD